jgi:hypothetical protein
VAAVEPDPAPVADELGHREDRHRVAHAEGDDEHGQQHRRAPEAGHRRQGRGEERNEADHDPGHGGAQRRRSSATIRR